MKRSIITIFSLSAMLFVFSGLASAQNVDNFTINSFNAEYNLTKNDQNISQMQVDEYINVQFPNYNQNHGILRAIPLKYNDTDLQLKVKSVDNASNSQVSSQTNWAYAKSKQNGNEVLKIGDAKIFLQGNQQFHTRITKLSSSGSQVERGYNAQNSL